MFDMNSGYSGYSMSKRAAEAYESGEMPWSKWSKSDILEEIIELSDEETPSFDIEKLNKAPTEVVRTLCLSYSSWHHTSKCCNRTNFYSIDECKIFALTNAIIDEETASYRNRKRDSIQEKEAVVYAVVRYGEWSKVRRRFKLYEYNDYGTIKGNVFTSHTGKRKRINGHHFHIVKRMTEHDYQNMIREKAC